jgi:hypothetical protein
LREHVRRQKEKTAYCKQSAKRFHDFVLDDLTTPRGTSVSIICYYAGLTPLLGVQSGFYGRPSYSFIFQGMD